MNVSRAASVQAMTRDTVLRARHIPLKLGNSFPRSVIAWRIGSPLTQESGQPRMSEGNDTDALCPIARMSKDVSRSSRFVGVGA